jgi:hypothetical protein
VGSGLNLHGHEACLYGETYIASGSFLLMKLPVFEIRATLDGWLK